jgi:acyl-CoA thioesterase YciA
MSQGQNSAAPPAVEPALRSIAMPADANPSGDVFGGWLLSQMDLAGGTVATQRARGRVATVAVTAMTFHLPVFIGDEVSCYAVIIKIGQSSLTVRIESWVRRRDSDERIKVTEGIFTYVAIGPDRRPRPVPPEPVPQDPVPQEPVPRGPATPDPRE